VAPGDHVVDLGCGNGIVGTVVALDQPEAELTFVDESFMAVASARDTYDANARSGADDAGGSARFVVGDGLAHLADGPPIQDGSVDLVLNNPPFHTDNAMGDATAWQMFSESHRALRSGGEIWVVGNRHLAYHAKLKRLFGNCDVVASSPKFVVCRAVRR
jgi:16S rRNA (guanine1207-N2)-methyltransferase